MKRIFPVILILFAGLIMTNCKEDNVEPGVMPTGNQKSFELASVVDPNISGTVTLIENDDNSITIDIELSNTSDGNEYPAHIHFNTAAEGGDIALTLASVDGNTGMSTITVTALDDSTPISYNDLLDFDGYVNVHLSPTELATLVAQGDIGQNELTGTSKDFTLNSVADPNINGMVTFAERKNGEALAILDLSGTPAGGSHPAHIHLNTAAEGGDIAFTFNPLNGDNGISKTNVSQLDNNTSFGYADVLDFDGYINVHLSSSELGTLVAQGDIGQNELTGTSKIFQLNSMADPNISGTATFEERVNGEALATIELSNTPQNGSHPAHIHNNTAADGGGIAYTFSPVDGNTGISKSNVAKLDDDTPIGYSDILEFNGYINVHLSSNDLATLVAQGDIGQNELTGEKTTYELETINTSGISGVADFEERANGTTLVTISLVGTSEGGDHPAHIHNNNASTGGGIAISLNNVDGTNGMSKTQVSKLNDNTAITYVELLDFNGYINVHLSSSELGVIVAQGDIGSNAGTGATVNYDVTNSGASAYVFTGGGLSAAQNPDLTLTRGSTYTFTVDAGGHPFIIKSIQGTGSANAYNNGVTNNGIESGTITFTVPNDAPNTLFYNCEFHSGMTGTINIVD